MFLNNRYYDPGVGVFASVDPLVGKTGTPYLYGGANPTTLSDPTGQEPAPLRENRCLYDFICGVYRRGYPGAPRESSAEIALRTVRQVANQFNDFGVQPPPNIGNLNFNDFIVEETSTNSSLGTVSTFVKDDFGVCEGLCFATVVGVSEVQAVSPTGVHTTIDTPSVLLGIFSLIPGIGLAGTGGGIERSLFEAPTSGGLDAQYEWKATMAIWDVDGDGNASISSMVETTIGIHINGVVGPNPGAPGSTGHVYFPQLGLTYLVGQRGTATMEWSKEWVG